MQLANQDVHMAGSNGLDVNISRTYNALSGDTTAFGLGWTMGTGADTILVIQSDFHGVVD